MKRFRIGGAAFIAALLLSSGSVSGVESVVVDANGNVLPTRSGNPINLPANAQVGTVPLAPFIGVGASHRAGLVPDPGTTGNPSDYLARDGGFKIMPTGGGGGGGDVSSNTTVSAAGEIALFSDTLGKTLGRSTGNGIAKLTNGVLGIAVAGTDYALPGGGGGGSGDVSSNTATSAIGEVALFSDTLGKTIKRGTGSGMAKLTSGVLGTGTLGTDYGDASTNTTYSEPGEIAIFSNTLGKTLGRSTGSGMAKLTSGVLGIGTAGTDYAPPLIVQYVIVASGSVTIGAGTDQIVIAQTTASGPLTLTLPAASSFSSSRRMALIDSTGHISATNTVSVVPPAGSTLNGGSAPVVVMANPFLQVFFTSNGSNISTVVQTPIAQIENYQNSTLTLTRPTVNSILGFDTSFGGTGAAVWLPSTDLTISSGNITLVPTGITAGTYSNPVVTADSNGRITGILNGSGGAPASPFIGLSDTSPVVWNAIPNVAQQNASITLGASRNLSIVCTACPGGIPQNGMHFTLKIQQDSAGSHTLTPPRNSITPNGTAGVITLSSAGGKVDSVDFTYDGSKLVFKAPELNLTGAADITAGMWQDFEGTDVTGPTLLANDHQGTGGWTFNDSEYKLSSDASGQMALPFSSINLQANSGLRGLKLDYSGTSATQVVFTFASSAGPSAVSYGFMLKTSTLSSDISVELARVSGSNVLVKVKYGKAAGVYTIFLQKVVGTNSSAITLTAGSTYWVTYLAQRNATCKMDVYDSAGAQVGTEVSVTGNDVAQLTASLGEGGTHTAQTASFYYDNWVMNTTGLFPLGP